MQRAEDAVDYAVLFEQRLPRERAEQKVHPHRQDEDEDHEIRAAYLLTAQNERERKGEQKADQRAHKGEQQRELQGLQVVALHDRNHIVERKGAAPVGQTEDKDQCERNHDKAYHPDQIGESQESCLLIH